jgi:cell division protein FtsL
MKLGRLREIRDIQRAAVALSSERDKLIRKALDEGYSERQVAKASGLSHSRIDQIAHSD